MGNLKKSMRSNKDNVRSLNSLGVLQNNQSIDDLLDEVQSERIAREVNELQTSYLDLEHNDANAKNEPIQTLLWTDKYSPKRIIDLLSSEKINREVTSWVKEWDYVVFGCKYRRNGKADKEAQKQKEKQAKKAQPVYSVRNNMPIFGQRETKNKLAPKINKGRPEVSVLL